MVYIGFRIKLRFISQLFISALALTLCVGTAALAQEEVWESYNNIGVHSFEEKEYTKAEEILLDAVKEAEKLQNQPDKLVTSLQVLYKVYLADNKQDQAEEIAKRLKSLGHPVPENSEQTKEGSSSPKAEEDTKDVTEQDASLRSPIGQPKKEQKPTSDLADAPLKGAQETTQTAPREETPASPTVSETTPNVVASAIGVAGEARVNTASQEAKEISHLLGHIGWTRSIQFSPDGTKALSGSSDFSMRLWDVSTGKEIRRFDGHEDAVNGVVFSEDGRRALSASSDKSVRLWDLDSGEQLQRLDGHTNIVTCVAFAPGGDRVASSGYDGTIRIWDTLTHKEIKCIQGNLGTVRCIVFSPDGSQLISAGSDRLISIWRVADGHLIRRLAGHKGEITDLDISKDGSKILSCSRDQSVRLWDLASGDELHSFLGHGNWVLRAEFSPDQSKALSGSLDKTFRVWDLASGKEESSFTIQNFGMWSLAFSKSGESALTGCNDFTLALWKLHL